MVDVSIQTLLNNEILSHKHTLSKNDAFLLSIMNRTKLEHTDHHAQERDVFRDDPAIVSVGRSNQCHQHKLQIHDADQQQINVVNQMLAQPCISYDILPKHFQPKLITVKPNSHIYPSLMHLDQNRKHHPQQQHYLIYNRSHEQQKHNPQIHSRLRHGQTSAGCIRANQRANTFRQQIRSTAEHVAKK